MIGFLTAVIASCEPVRWANGRLLCKTILPANCIYVRMKTEHIYLDKKGQDMNIQVSTVLDQLVHRLVDHLQPKSIYLFGSQARGDANPKSDYDLLIVVPESSLPRHQRETKAYDALWNLSYPAELVVLTTAEFEQAQQIVTSLASTVLKEGTLLYG